MTLFRPEIEQLEQNGITKVALPRLGDPAVLPLWFGEGDAVTAEFIRDAAKRALDAGETFYCHTRGHPDLRDAIRAYLERMYGRAVDPDRITVPGATMLGITLAAQMTLGRGDHGLIVAPNWPNIDNTFQVTGAEIGFVRQRDDGDRWRLDLDEVEAAVRPETRAIFVNTPCNPTGWVMSREEMQRLLELCRARDIVLIADEVYHRHVFEGDLAPSFMEIAEDEDPVVVVSGFSKAWAMTGWRLGWMVTPARFATQMAVLSECFNTGATVFAQLAGVVALEEGESVVADLRAQYARGKDLVMAALGDHPHIELLEPEGAFYAFPRVPGLRSSLEFVQGLLEEEDVGVAPGYTFGPGSEEHFRLCFALSHERLEEALGRIRRYLDRRHNTLIAR